MLEFLLKELLKHIGQRYARSAGGAILWYGMQRAAGNSLFSELDTAIRSTLIVRADICSDCIIRLQRLLTCARLDAIQHQQLDGLQFFPYFSRAIRKSFSVSE